MSMHLAKYDFLNINVSKNKVIFLYIQIQEVVNLFAPHSIPFHRNNTNFFVNVCGYYKSLQVETFRINEILRLEF